MPAEPSNAPLSTAARKLKNIVQCKLPVPHEEEAIKDLVSTAPSCSLCWVWLFAGACRQYPRLGSNFLVQPDSSCVPPLPDTCETKPYMYLKLLVAACIKCKPCFLLRHGHFQSKTIKACSKEELAALALQPPALPALSLASISDTQPLPARLQAVQVRPVAVCHYCSCHRP